MSSGTFSQLYVQLVFAVQGRQNLILPDWEDELYKYITGIIQLKGQKLLAINGMPDHVHIFISMKPTCCLSDLVREVKNLQIVLSKQRVLLMGNLSGNQDLVLFRIVKQLLKM
jgi:REP element-mobilizing transposase RayT